jgi:hypothetical protein
MKAGLRTAVLIAGCVAGCGGGGGGGGSNAPPGPRSVIISWVPNHEKGVNSAGGGYRVSITGQPPITLPYTSGPAAPTSTAITLPQGTYTVTVTAFAALDPLGGMTGSVSAPSQAVNVNVP